MKQQQDEPDRLWMLIEDDLFYKLLIRMVERFGWESEIRRFTNGNEAVQWLEDFREGRYDGPIPELVISGHKLDGPDGLEVCRELRKIPELAGMPFLLINVRFRPEEVQEINALVDGYLGSPTKPSDLRAAIEEVLEVRQRKGSGR